MIGVVLLLEKWNFKMQTQIIPICFITPNNFSHKAGDGVATRKHGTSLIHPALQANCGGSQMTFLLELWEVKDSNDKSE